MNLWKSLSSLLIAPTCPLCDRPSPRFFCRDCDRQLHACQFDRPAADWQGDLPIFAWGKYEGTLKRSIAALKYNGQPQIAQPLGLWLGEAWQQTMQIPACAIVPIPLHAAKQKQRGYNQATLLAESFCQATRLPLASDALWRIRSTEAQFKLGAIDRAQNLANAFAVNSAFRQRSAGVLLLDDIYTTGATVNAAASCLQQQGIRVRGVIALSRTAKR
ncbi:ComF family protein [Microcoleus sp. FACHB-1515]|uniref:ComF family protein n=1 Tax=Cyanophyceae TaxID=3028117 RepID=UPI0016863F83|nr:ComF family protein [Microcoleus sp. FACHB-1515]MBD2090112.1 ComF family protein [Microcoleus sp. FACHB-1515]